LNVLQRDNIISAPVVDDGRFLGFVDVLDIAGYILHVWKSLSRLYEEHLFPRQELFNETPIRNVLNFSKLDIPAFISEDASVEDLIYMFLDPNFFNRLRRVAVVNSSEVKNTLSQSDIISFAIDNLNSIDPTILNKTIYELGYLVRTTIMARIDTPFIDALELLFQNKISGLALVDQDFRFCGNLSASDLRGLKPTSFEFFTSSTLSFLCKGVDQEYKGSISVLPTSNLTEVLQTLSRNHIHRVYVTKDNGYLLGVISLIDIISRLQ